MQHLLPFRLFEARASRLPSGLTPDQEEFLNRYTQGAWSVNPKTGLVDVRGNFNCSNIYFSHKRLKSLQGVSFGQVSGGFYCHYNHLTSLTGVPQTVGKRFDCAANQLTTLEGAPQTVGEDFVCSYNLLTTLDGAPRKVGGHFYCSDNPLTSLAGAPQTVGGHSYCNNNQLTSLAGAPQTVGGHFYCNNNQLTSLVGAPQTVGGGFECASNQLTTFEGAPRTVGGRFYCDSFALDPGEWNPPGWLKIMRTGNDAARRLILTLPIFDPDRWLQRLTGDLKKDGQVLLQLAALWEEPDWAGQRQEIEQRLSPEQLRAIKVLRTKVDYVNPWQGGVLEDI